VIIDFDVVGRIIKHHGLAFALRCSAGPVAQAQLLGAQDVVKLPSSPADYRIQYGSVG